MKVFKCKKCGTMVEEIKLGGCHPSCCGEPMQELVVGTSDGAREKHVPEVTIEGNTVCVQVGSVAHPMVDVHYIEWIAMETNQGIQRKSLQPGSEPKAVFALTEGEKCQAVYAYCNLHGLWKAE